MNNCTDRHSEYFTKGGTYEMDGIQATAYARIRYTTGGDWKRTERQREVLDLTFEKMKKMNIGQLNDVASTVLKRVSTNVSNGQILYLLSQAASYEIEDTTGWPYDVEDYQPAKIWYGVPGNLESEVVALHKFLFDREDYEVSQTVKTISDTLIKKTGINKPLKEEGKGNTNSNTNSHTNTVTNSTVTSKK